ncbi:uncharacterized protein C11orf96-like [Delphinus delphis]|uniref:uncharacterized protein C11orf96-like n=1 Tax=Delphinus delphis TaxID=9728 RepID=UPI0037536E5B
MVAGGGEGGRPPGTPKRDRKAERDRNRHTETNALQKRRNRHGHEHKRGPREAAALTHRHRQTQERRRAAGGPGRPGADTRRPRRRPSAPARRAPARAHLGPLTPRSRGSWRAAPCPRSASVSRGARRAASGGRGAALRRTRGRTEGRTPTAPPPRRGAENRAGEGSRRADGKQPKEATDRKRKWPRDPPSRPVCGEPAQWLLPRTRSPACRHFRRAGAVAKSHLPHFHPPPRNPGYAHGEAGRSEGSASELGRRRRDHVVVRPRAVAPGPLDRAPPRCLGTI